MQSIWYAMQSFWAFLILAVVVVVGSWYVGWYMNNVRTSSYTQYGVLVKQPVFTPVTKNDTRILGDW